MKKYQLWLERKSYSQHLFNLIKIKQAFKSHQNKQKTPIIRHTFSESSQIPKYKDLDSEVSKLGDITYAIPFRQLKNKKLRIMKAFDIVNQNISMARKIKDAKSIFNITKSKCLKSEDKRRQFQKKWQNKNDELRNQNYKKFIKWQNTKYRSLVNHYILMVHFQDLNEMIFLCKNDMAVWCQIETNGTNIKSELIDIDSKNFTFYFPSQNQISESVKLSLFTCKGLVCIKMGEMLLERPQLQGHLCGDFKTIEGRYQFKLDVSYSKIGRKQMPKLNVK